MNFESQTSDIDASNEEARRHNLKSAGNLKKLAWTIKIILVTVGLGIAFAQALSMPDGSGVVQMFPVFGVFVILAAVELAKIPAATVVFHAQGWRKMLPLVGLFVVSLISFETIFNGFERYAYQTTRPVAEAKTNLAALEGDKAQLLEVALLNETDGSRVASLDDRRIADQRKAVAVYQAAAERARANLDSEETKELKAQLASLIEQQNTAGEEAKTAWNDEQESILTRLEGDAIDDRMRRQLNNRMHAMPALQTAISKVRVKFDAPIAQVNQAIEASITEPSLEALAILEAAEIRLTGAQDQLNTIEIAAAERADARIANEVANQETAKTRAAEIEQIESQIVAAQRSVEVSSETSQLHRWAAFVFGVNPAEISNEQVKRTGAVFGVILAIVGALTGASVAMYSEWFRARGIQPKVIVKQVPVEVIVEKEVEKIVEVEVPTIKYKYVPVPIGDDLEEAVEGLLQALPKEAADELRAQLADFTVIPENEEETPYARAA